MNFATRTLLLFLFLFIWSSFAEGKSLEHFVKQAALNNGLTNPSEMHAPYSDRLAKIGETFFNSKSMSLNGQMSCQTCHLDEFGSADGIPNAIGVGGEGKGQSRVMGGGAVVPRNTLPLWGRGDPSFKTFFWDGKVDASNGNTISQFGDKLPTNDPLLVSIHLPVVEIREMLAEDNFVGSRKTETVEDANEIFSKVVAQLISKHPFEAKELSIHQNKTIESLNFNDVAISIKDFFRKKFAIKPYKFSNFVFHDSALNENEMQGATLFYGKGKCSLCHSGQFYSDFSFHSVPFPQLGSGKNGFGVDYGRFNVTHDPDDLYKFRTPPLLNVSKTAPYGHSGSVASVEEAIALHFDPLRGLDLDKMGTRSRVELFKRLAGSSQPIHTIPTLSEQEIRNLLEFLNTLSF